jgi:TetR/AcrR family transcriptional regulator
MPTSTFFNLPEEKRQKILDCAIDEFAQFDYDSASISKIVTRAVIAKGSMYQYFEDKRDLYYYLLEEANRKKAELLNSASPLDHAQNVFDNMRHLFKVMSSFELRYPKLAQVGYRAIQGKSPLPEEIVIQGKRSSQQYFIGMIEEGKRQGQIRQEIDAEIVSFVFTTIIAELGNLLKEKLASGALTNNEQKAISSKQDEIEQVYNQIVSILQDGIANN